MQHGIQSDLYIKGLLHSWESMKIALLSLWVPLCYVNAC